MTLKPGITYAHEHVTIDLSGVKQDLDCRLDLMDETISEFRRLKELGVANIIDVTNRGMGRNIAYVQQVARQTGLNILVATGYYKEPFLPQEVYDLSELQLAEIMVAEIMDGIEGSGIKASLIGEVGTSQAGITPVERKLLGAAARAHAETGKPVSTHTTLGRLGLEQAKILKDYGVDLTKVVIGHVDLSGDLDYALRLLDTGTNIAFDTVGKVNYMADNRRLAMLQEICRRGLFGQVLLSLDITRRSHLKSRGGLGYAYLLDTFVPYIRANGISEQAIDHMLIQNPQKIYL